MRLKLYKNQFQFNNWYIKLGLFSMINLLLFYVIIYNLKENPKLIDISKMDLISKQKDSINVDFETVLLNPNYFPISGKKIHFDAIDGTDTIGYGFIPLIAIGSRQNDTMKIQVTFFQNKLGKYLIPPIDSIKISLNLSGNFSPFYFHQEIKIPLTIPPSKVKSLFFNALLSDNAIHSKRNKSIYYTRCKSKFHG